MVAMLAAASSVSCDAPPASRPASATAPPHAGFVPLSEHAGAIGRIVLHAREATLAEAALAFYDLLGALRPETPVTFVCDSAASVNGVRGRLRQWKLDRRPGIEVYQFPGALSQWARDRYIAGNVDGGAVWLVPRVPAGNREPARESERDVPEAFAGILPGLRVQACDVVLEGGNVISTGQSVLIGANVQAENSPAWGPEETRGRLESLFGLPVTLVQDDTGGVPVRHIDLFLTAVGEDQLLVGSPALAAEILEKSDARSRGAAVRRLGFAPPDTTAERAGRFDAVARRLSRAGFRIRRVPYLDNRGGDFAISYNNVLQEEREGGKVVYLPIYRVPALDAAAREVYQSMGFTVRTVDVTSVCHLLGAVRCLANVVERGPPAGGGAGSPAAGKPDMMSP
jgi:N-dimethylarginine dimethylaminohydrolase